MEESPGRSLLQKLLEQPIPSHVDTFKSMQKYLELSDEDRQKMREDTEKFLGNTEESKRKSFDILKKILRDEDRGTDSK